jgi:hypothetical protein
MYELFYSPDTASLTPRRSLSVGARPVGRRFLSADADPLGSEATQPSFLSGIRRCAELLLQRASVQRAAATERLEPIY